MKDDMSLTDWLERADHLAHVLQLAVSNVQLGGHPLALQAITIDLIKAINEARRLAKTG